MVLLDRGEYWQCGFVIPKDAVAAANLLSYPLREGNVSKGALESVQQRRERPARLTQSAQIFMHKRFLGPIFRTRRPVSAPWPIRLMQIFPVLRRIPAQLVGIGVRLEHVYERVRKS
jgi:hypothetical protein